MPLPLLTVELSFGGGLELRALAALHLFHQWHGDLGDRQYGIRRNGLTRARFDPADDIAISSHGCWRWNSPKPDPHRFVRNLFTARKEDGQEM